MPPQMPKMISLGIYVQILFLVVSSLASQRCDTSGTALKPQDFSSIKFDYVIIGMYFMLLRSSLLISV